MGPSYLELQLEKLHDMLITCPTCGLKFNSMLALAEHNEATNHLREGPIEDKPDKSREVKPRRGNQIPPPPRGLVTEPPKPKVIVKRRAEMSGHVYEKEYVK